MRIGIDAALVLLTAAAFAQDPKASPAPKYRMDVVYIFATDEPKSTTEAIIVIGNSGFRSLAALKQFVRTLRPGTVLEWAPGCERLGGEPLLTSTKDMAEFRAACKERKVTFILHPSG